VHEFPETLEEITVWKLEHADLLDSYFNMMWNQLGAWFSGDELHKMILEWLARIHKFSGIVTHCAIGFALSAHGPRTRQVRVSVAGIFVCVLDEQELAKMQGEPRDPT
jgi:hypothetical protein